MTAWHLARNKITAARVDQVMSLPAGDREKQLTELSNENEGRLKLLQEAAGLFDASAVKEKELTAATDPAAKDKLVGDVAEAQLKYEEARKKVLDTALSADDIIRVVQSSKRQRMIDEGGKEPVPLPSPRMVAEKTLKSSHPEAEAEIQSILDAYDAYANERFTLDDQRPGALIKGAGVLSFRITVDPTDPALDVAKLRRELRSSGREHPGPPRPSGARSTRSTAGCTPKEIDFLTGDPEKNTPDFFASRGYIAEHTPASTTSSAGTRPFAHYPRRWRLLGRQGRSDLRPMDARGQL